VAVHLLAPLTAGVSSYSGVVVLVAVTAVTLAVVGGRASPRERQGAARGAVGLRLPRPQPGGAIHRVELRPAAAPRVRDDGVRAREQVDMPEPGDGRPARFVVTMRDLAWDAFYAPVERSISWLTDRFNPLQYLTIRRYLVFMFTALIVLLVTVALVK
jgi:hypothetical protein